jgi:hypothetical protein
MSMFRCRLKFCGIECIRLLNEYLSSIYVLFLVLDVWWGWAEYLRWVTMITELTESSVFAVLISSSHVGLGTFCRLLFLENSVVFCCYCNKFAGSIHNWSLLHWKLNTQLLITVHNSSRILTHVWQILELQPILLLYSSFSTGSLIRIPIYNQ